MTKNYIEQESGRSMVEMLGVLAIIGVLSVGGISGYTTAMNKHKANEILNAAAVRAMAVSTQLQSGVTDPTLAEFPTNEEVGGAKFGDVSKVGDSQFKIGFTTQPTPAVVEQMKNIAGDNVGVDGSRLLYNNDLSSGVDNTATNPDHRDDSTGECLSQYKGADCDTCAEGYEKQSDGTCATPAPSCTGSGTGGALLECESCSGGVAVDDDSICLDAGKGLCVDGTCQASKFTSGCTTNADCQGKESIDGVDCKNNTCYCNYGGNSNGVDCNVGPTMGGTCKIATIKVGTEAAPQYNNLILSQDDMDWFSAKNFCAALPGNHHMVSLAESGVDKANLGTFFESNNTCYDPSSEYKEGGDECDTDGFKASNYAGTQLAGTYWWTKDLTNGSNSCIAFGVATNLGGYVDGGAIRASNNYALCK